MMYFHITLYNQTFSDMPRWKAGQPAPSIQCPACPGVFRTKQGLSHHCTAIHNNPLAVLEQIRHENHFPLSISCSLTHVLAEMSIDAKPSVQPPLPPPLLPPLKLPQMRRVNCGMLQTPVQGRLSLKGII